MAGATNRLKTIGGCFRESGLPAEHSICLNWWEELPGVLRPLGGIDLAGSLPRELALALERDAPDSLGVPSGRRVPLDYAADGSVSASVKLQELFGLAETPRVGPRGEPVLLELLAPNGRAVQLTRDLRSFWDRTYPEVRKELRGRYPKHPWPEIHGSTPTHRASHAVDRSQSRRPKPRRPIAPATSCLVAGPDSVITSSSVRRQ